jgi:hypothetical protein
VIGKPFNIVDSWESVGLEVHIVDRSINWAEIHHDLQFFTIQVYFIFELLPSLPKEEQ